MINKFKLGDVSKLSMGFVGTVTSQYEEGGIPFFRTVNIKPYKIINDDLKTISKEFHESQKKSQLNEGDVAMVHTGVPGFCCVIPKEYDNSNCIDMIVIKPKTELIDPFYLEAYMNTIGYKHIQKQQVGGNQKHFNLKDAQDLEIFLPDLATQNKIGTFIKKINEKIFINNKINEDILNFVRLIFDYWFLQFNFPDENNQPYKSYNGEMILNDEMNMDIPKGWNIGSLDDIAEYINGLACQKHRPINDTDKLPVIKIGEMHDGITEKTEFVRSDIDKKHIIDDGDILFSWSATLETMIWTGGKGGLNQHIFKVIPKEYGKYYVFMMLSAYINNFVRMAESRKTTMGHITREHLLQSKIPLPPKELTYKFDRLVSVLFDKYINNNIENRQLISLREFSIPLLINGQIRFK